MPFSVCFPFFRFVLPSANSSLFLFRKLLPFLRKLQSLPVVQTPALSVFRNCSEFLLFLSFEFRFAFVVDFLFFRSLPIFFLFLVDFFSPAKSVGFYFWSIVYFFFFVFSRSFWFLFFCPLVCFLFLVFVY